MKFLDTIKERILLLDQATMRQYFIGFFIAVLTLLSIFMYSFYSRKSSTLTKFKALNRQRLETQEVLTRYAIVQRQKEDVENLLKEDETFFIGQYFSDLMANQKIPTSSFQQQEPITEDATQDYNQVRLSASISGIDMKQLTDLLNTIEQEERIYIEELDIIKDNKLKKIDVNIVIATLEPKQVSVE